MSLPRVTSREEWLAARKELLADEKAMTRARDKLNTKRRELPMVRVDKEYVFEGRNGKATLLDLFEDRRQLVLVHFMFDPNWDDGCPSCTAGADEVSAGLMDHLHTRDTTLAYVSRAPSTRSSATRPSGVGRFPGSLRSGATSTTTSTSRSTNRSLRSSTTSARRQNTPNGAWLSRAASRSRCPDAATSCATATPSSIRTRSTRGVSSRSVVRTTCSTRPCSDARRHGRNRRTAPRMHEVPCPTSRPERSGQPGPVTCTQLAAGRRAVRTCVRVRRGDDPARRSRLLLRIGRATRRPTLARPAGHRGRRGRARRQLRSQGQGRADRDGRGPRPPPVSGRDRRLAANVGICRGQQSRVRRVRRHHARRRGDLDRRGIPRGRRAPPDRRRADRDRPSPEARRRRAGRPADHRRRCTHEVPRQGGQQGGQARRAPAGSARRRDRLPPSPPRRAAVGRRHGDGREAPPPRREHRGRSRSARRGGARVDARASGRTAAPRAVAQP